MRYHIDPHDSRRAGPDRSRITTESAPHAKLGRLPLWMQTARTRMRSDQGRVKKARSNLETPHRRRPYRWPMSNSCSFLPFVSTLLVSMSVSREEVRHVAQLARLDFSEEDEARMADELSQILEYVDKLDELDTSGVPPMSHVLDVTNVFRPDEVEERIDRGEALELAPEADDEYFRVPKVVG